MANEQQEKIHWLANRKSILVEITYWLLIPVSIGIMIGWYAGEVTDLNSRLRISGFWIIFVSFTWWVLICGAWFAYWALRSWQPSPLTIWLPGPLMFGLFALPVQNELMVWGSTYLPSDVIDRDPIQMSYLTDPKFWFFYLNSAIPGTLVFAFINFLFERILGLGRFRYKISAGESLSLSNEGTTATANTETISLPRFMERLPEEIKKGTLICVSAQEHYIMVTTSTGKELIRYSFNEASKDLNDYSGLRTHRSHWVATEAIEDLIRLGSSYNVQLQNGLSIPVSRTYLVNVRQYLPK